MHSMNMTETLISCAEYAEYAPVGASSGLTASQDAYVRTSSSISRNGKGPFYSGRDNLDILAQPSWLSIHIANHCFELWKKHPCHSFNTDRQTDRLIPGLIEHDRGKLRARNWIEVGRVRVHGLLQRSIHTSYVHPAYLLCQITLTRSH